MQPNLRIYNELIKLVTDSEKEYSVFPFPTIAGHTLIHRLVNEYAVFDEESIDNFSLLHNNKFVEIEENIKKGCHLDKTDKINMTLLHHMCCNKRLEIATLLFENQFRITPLPTICSPLIKSSVMHQTNIINLLVSYGADINHQDNGGLTPLIYASCFSDTYRIQHLIDKKADVDITAKSGQNALQLACCKGKIENFKILIKYIKYDKDNLLKLANYNRDEKVKKELNDLIKDLK